MNKEFLERLYWAVADEATHLEDGFNLSELYERDGEARAAASAISTAIGELNLTLREKTLLENLSGSVADAYEKQGFINGFRLGMKLAGELKEETV